MVTHVLYAHKRYQFDSHLSMRISYCQRSRYFPSANPNISIAGSRSAGVVKFYALLTENPRWKRSKYLMRLLTMPKKSNSA